MYLVLTLTLPSHTEHLLNSTCNILRFATLFFFYKEEAAVIPSTFVYEVMH